MSGMLGIKGSTFRDDSGRHVILRGVNFGGDTKLPVIPNGSTHLPTNFSDHRKVSFVGRPASLDDLDTHLARMEHWGFNVIRLLTTWEAVEHEGPGQYDEAYLDYLAEVCRRAGTRGIRVFIDFHQDVWSRMSGGDGAPGWTWEAAGLDFTKFHASGAAHVMQHNYDHRLGGRQSSYPVMSWGGNYSRPANGIIWTLFFAGMDFAPSAVVDGRNIQQFLQQHYLGAMKKVAERVSALDNVLGFDTLNEPGTGYIGKPLDQPFVRGDGPVWTPLEGLAIASGSTRELPVMEFGKGIVGTRRMNEEGASIWLPGHEDPFRAAGAWELDSEGAPVTTRPDFFQRVGAREVNIDRDYMVPFFNRVADTVRSLRPDWLIFAELDPFDAMKGHGFPEGCPKRSVNASHWYDITMLVTKRFSAEQMTHVFSGAVLKGEQAIEESYIAELGRLKAAGDGLNGGAPTLIGECGIPFDLNEGAAYRDWSGGARGDSVWAAQTVALDLMYNAIDHLLLSSTQWNYTVSNRNDPMIGDGWNQEDLSIWSEDQVEDYENLDSGGRATHGFCRPFVRAAQGTIVSQRFDRRRGFFEAVIDVDPLIPEPTEIYVPKLQFPAGFDCEIRGSASIKDSKQQLNVTSTFAGTLAIRLHRK